MGERRINPKYLEWLNSDVIPKIVPHWWPKTRSVKQIAAEMDARTSVQRKLGETDAELRARILNATKPGR